MKRGHLIVFEGADGVGKTELARRTAETLASLVRPCEYLPFPGRADGSLGLLVYRLHHRPMEVGVLKMTATARQALHVAAHLDGLEDVLLPSLAAGTTILLDRFWWSTIVYGRVDGIPEETITALIALERCGWGDVVPDIILLISREEPLREEPRDAWQQIATGYKRLAQEEEGRYPIVRIDNAGRPEAAVKNIIYMIKDLVIASSPSITGT